MIPQYLKFLIESFLRDKINQQIAVRFLLPGVRSDDGCAETSSKTTKIITGGDFVVPLIEVPLSVVEQVLGKGYSSGLKKLPYEILSRGETSSPGEPARPAMIALMANDMKLSEEERLRRVAELSAAMVDPLQGIREDPIMDAIVRIIGSYAGYENTRFAAIRVNPERIIPLISEKIPKLDDENKAQLAIRVAMLIESLSSMMTDEGRKIPLDEIFRRLMLCPNLRALHNAIPELDIPDELL